MNKRNMSRTVSATAATLLVASLALVGCGKRDDGTAMNTPTTTESTTVAQIDRPADVQADTSRTEQAKDNAREVGRDVRDATKEASEKAGSKVNDALITTTVNAELAKDSSLSAVKIDVDTDAGRVALKGTAPSETARARATQLASNVNGVVSVDNQLTIEPRKM